MIAVGLDYGTTNTLLTVYQKDMTKNDIVRVQIPSSYRDESVYEPSPKRLINKLSSENIAHIETYIKDCIGKLFSALRQRYRELDFSDVRLAVSIPNGFNDIQLKFMKLLVENIVKLDFPASNGEVEIIPEPVAAALYLAYSRAEKVRSHYEKYFLVSDMGGGTTDTAIVRININSGDLKFKVICTEQNPQLGGVDIDKAVADYIRMKYDLSDVDSDDIERACCHLKEQLTFFEEVRTAIIDKTGNQYIIDGEPLELELSRDDFEDIMDNASVKSGLFSEVYGSLLEKLKGDFENIMAKEGYSEDKIESIEKYDLVLLPVGGASRIPKIQEYLQKAFPDAQICTLNTEDDKNDQKLKFDSVCRGAAIYAAYMTGQIDEDIQGIEIEGRSLHKVSLRYTDDKLLTCIDKNMCDGDHFVLLNPKAFRAEGGCFQINTLEFYQGGYGEHLSEDCVLLKRIDIPDVIYTDITDLSKITIKMKVTMQIGRLTEIIISIPKCHLENETKDYSKTFEFI